MLKNLATSGDRRRPGARDDHPPGKCLMSRRQFLLTSGAATATMMVTVNAGTPLAKEMPAVVATYPRKLVTQLSALKQDAPVDFTYPDQGSYAESLIVKLGVPSGGGIGPDRDVVAFNAFCTHQGGDLTDTYKGDTKSLGACPLHLSTYDLTRQLFADLPAEITVDLRDGDQHR